MPEPFSGVGHGAALTYGGPVLPEVGEDAPGLVQRTPLQRIEG